MQTLRKISFIVILFISLSLSQRTLAQLASILDATTFILEIPVVQVGDDYYQLNLLYAGGSTFSLAGASIADDSVGIAGTLNLDNLTLQLPLVIFQDARYELTLLYNGVDFTLTSIGEITASDPVVRGKVIPPEIYTTYTNGLPSGGVSFVCMITMTGELIGECLQPEALVESLDFSFTGTEGEAYIVTTTFGNGGGFSLITDPLLGDFYKDLDVSAEIEFNLVYTIAFPQGKANGSTWFTGYESELQAWNEAAKTSVDRYREFEESRDSTIKADALTEAVFNMTIDQLNQGTGVEIELLQDTNILRAYGAGSNQNRSVQDLLDYPQPPLNPGFVFAAEKSLSGGGSEKNVGFSNIDGKQWDFLTTGTSPHINVGGEQIVYADADLSTLGTSSFYLSRIYRKTLGSSEIVAISPDGLHCAVPRVSADGTLVAYACIDVDSSVSGTATSQGAYNLFIADLYTKEIIHSVSNVGDFDLVHPDDIEVISFGATGSAWSKDGKNLFYSVVGVNKSDPANVVLATTIYSYNLESKTSSELWSLDNALIIPGLSMTPDQDDLFFSMTFIGGDIDGDNSTNIFRFDINSNEAYYFTQTPDLYEAFPSVSFNGRFLIYVDKSGSAGKQTVKLVNRYTGDVEKDFGDFANAESYFTPTMIATEFGLVAAEGTETDEYGEVISNDDTRTSSNYSGIDDHDRIYNETRNTVIQSNPNNYIYYSPIDW